MTFEGAIKMQFGEEVQISDQQLVSCGPYSNGCKGGFMTTAWHYQRLNGVVSAADYPYTSGATRSPGECAIPEDAQWINYKPIYRDLIRKSPDMIKRALIEDGPIATALSVRGTPGFMSYSGGILRNVSTQYLDHAMIIVGYTKDAWILQNSWGPGWGDGGRM